MYALLMACVPTEQELAEYTAQIAKTEKEFEAVANAEGLASAFSHYADETAVISRGGKLVRGKDSIRLFYEHTPPGAHLSWTPDVIEVSKSGDLGYTYGRYVYEAVDSTGESIRSEGIFHTVWKRQADGMWRFVWD